MKILYLVPHIPNPTKARSYFQIRGLMEAGHHVTVATLERSQADREQIRRLEQRGVQVISERLTIPQALINVLPIVLTTRPFQSKLFWSSKLMRAIEARLLADPPDIIHVEHLRMACYGLQLVHRWPLVWDAVDYLSPLYQEAATTSTNRGLRLAASLESPRLCTYEHWLTGQFAATLVISPRDQALFQRDNQFADRVKLVPPGLPIQPLAFSKPRLSDTLIMTGTFNYHPNISSARYFVNDVFPLIQQRWPGVRLQLVGANPVPAIQSLKSSHIEVTGFVSTITDSLQQATIAVAPVLYGAGMQNKVIEAFMTETPLVATSVALKGLNVRDQEHVLVADSAADFAEAVLVLLADPGLRERLAYAARHYVEKHHELRTTTQRLIEVYTEVREQFGQ